MIRLGVQAFGVAGAPEGFPGHDAWPQDPRIRHVIGDEGAVSKALHAHYPPLKLRRLDPYAATALLAARLALEAWTMPENPVKSTNPVEEVWGESFPPAGSGAEPRLAGLGLVVCTGRGPVPAINAFTDSYLDFGLAGASPTAFSQTVHNVAASTISMFLDIEGPSLTVSQPELGVSAALCTIGAWLASGFARAVLFGAVDDYQGFSSVLEPSPGHCSHNPVAVFTVLGAGGLAADLFCLAREAERTRRAGPVEILSGFLPALAAGRGGVHL